jgi:nicotinamidase/pyrazinamidase
VAQAIFGHSEALLVVDLQYDFLPGGSLAVPRADEILGPIAGLIRRFETVVATQDFHPPGHVSFASSHPGARAFQTIALPSAAGERREQVLWPDHCVAGTPGAALARDLPDDALSLILRKGMRVDVDSYSAFREDRDQRGKRRTTGLADWLHARGVVALFVVGLARDFCVRATAVDAVAEGFEVTVVDELTRAVWPARARLTDEALAAAGVQVRGEIA